MEQDKNKVLKNEAAEFCLTWIPLPWIIVIAKDRLMDSIRNRKKDERKKGNKPAEDWEKELNIKYHDVNPEWNYTIFPRPISKQTKKDKK